MRRRSAGIRRRRPNCWRDHVRFLRYDVVLDPTRLRPHWAVLEEVKSVSGEPMRSRRMRYQFDWSYDQRDAAESVALTCPPGASGEIRRDDVQAVVRGNIDLVRGCYEAGLLRDPDVRGQVTIDFTIAPDGRVQASEIAASEVPAAVAECIRFGLLTFRFPPPRCGEVKVRYPFVLEPSDPPPKRRRGGAPS